MALGGSESHCDVSGACSNVQVSRAQGHQDVLFKVEDRALLPVRLTLMEEA